MTAKERVLAFCEIELESLGDGKKGEDHEKEGDPEEGDAEEIGSSESGSEKASEGQSGVAWARC